MRLFVKATRIIDCSVGASHAVRRVAVPYNFAEMFLRNFCPPCAREGGNRQVVGRVVFSLNTEEVLIFRDVVFSGDS